VTQSPKRLAYLGPAGTFSELACVTYGPADLHLPYPSFQAAVSAVDRGEADEAVLPIENSIEGPIAINVDLLIHDSDLRIRNEVVVPVWHYLMAHPGASLADIKVVYSHPQPLAQCRKYLSRSLPQVELVASLSTAAAVQDMMKLGREVAAIAPKRAAELYGATILVERIEDNPSNMTRFVVLGRTDHPRTGRDKTSICFSFAADAPGILYSVLGEFATRKINMEKIESRPTKQSLGRYVFLVDLEGHREDRLLGDALEAVKKQVSMFKVFGSYPKFEGPTNGSPGQ